MKPWARFVLLLIAVLGFVAATTYPYTFLKNHARLTQGAATFEKPGILVWRGAGISPATQRIAVRLIAKPYRTDQGGPARIFTISRDHFHANLTIGQEGRDLAIRLRRDGDNALGIPPFVVPRVFDSLEAQAIEVVVDQRALGVTVNGKRALSETLVDNPFLFWDETYLLALGNEHTWQRPWTGSIDACRLAVDATTIDLLDAESTARAGILHLLRHKLEWVSRSVVDLLVNFVLMIPVGALTAWTFSRHRIVASLGLWFVVAALAETTQALIPARVPAISDLALNVSGAGVGAWMLAGFYKLRRCRQANEPAPGRKPVSDREK